MKLKLKIPQKSKPEIKYEQFAGRVSRDTKTTTPPTTKEGSLSSLGTMEQLADKKYLEQLHKEALATNTQARYYDMLETQISSLADKVVKMDITRSEVPDSNNHLNKLRIAINNAVNELSQAQQYARDHIDK